MFIVEAKDPKVAKINRREVKETVELLREHKLRPTRLCSACKLESSTLQKCSQVGRGCCVDDLLSRF